MPNCSLTPNQQCRWQVCYPPQQTKYILTKIPSNYPCCQGARICYLRKTESTPVISKPSSEKRDEQQSDAWAGFPNIKVNEESATRSMNRIPRSELSKPLEFVRYKRCYGARFIHEGVRTYDGRLCVLKHLRRGGENSEEIILTMGMAKRAAFIVASFKRAIKAIDDERYQRRCRSRRRCTYIDSLDGWEIEVNVPVPYYGDYPHEKGFLIEPFVYGHRDFNSDAGWARDSPKFYNQIVQALSHYSYGYSDGTFLMCNLKAGVDSERRILTICNPSFMSRGEGGVFGPLDTGSRGMELFFRSYQSGELGEGWPKYPDKRG